MLENLLAFEVERANLLRILNGLSLEQWARSARFTGKHNTHTVFDETVRMARHEAEHCQQLETILLSG